MGFCTKTARDTRAVLHHSVRTVMSSADGTKRRQKPKARSAGLGFA